VIVLLGAMIPIGGALETTGAAQWLARGILDVAGDAGPGLLLAVSLIATMAITPLLNNTATVIIMAPIVLGVSGTFGAAPEPFLMAVAIGASSDFLTPFGHHNNTIILGPGRYRFVDFLRLGLPLDAIVILVAMLTIPLVWPF
jgi:di/tricarboxylate transporter